MDQSWSRVFNESVLVRTQHLPGPRLLMVWAPRRPWDFFQHPSILFLLAVNGLAEAKEGGIHLVKRPLCTPRS